MLCINAYSLEFTDSVVLYWNAILPELLRSNAISMEEECECNERKLRVSGVTELLEKKHFPIADVRLTGRTVNGMVPFIKLGCPKGDGFAVNMIFGVLVEPETINELGWALAKVDYTTYVRCFDEKFENFQNLSRADMYGYYGLSLKGLRLIDDPRFGKLVDVSQNPGRTVWYGGEYEEGLGHLMWLCPKFWEVAGMPEVIPSPLHHHEKRDGITFCVLRKEPFTMEDPGADTLNAIRPQLFRKRRGGHIGALYLPSIRRR